MRCVSGASLAGRTSDMLALSRQMGVIEVHTNKGRRRSHVRTPNKCSVARSMPHLRGEICALEPPHRHPWAHAPSVRATKAHHAAGQVSRPTQEAARSRYPTTTHACVPKLRRGGVPRCQTETRNGGFGGRAHGARWRTHSSIQTDGTGTGCQGAYTWRACRYCCSGGRAGGPGE